MKYDELISHVSELAGLDRSEAERAAHATLATLAERITEGEASHLAAQLPQDLQPALEGATGTGEPFPVDEFFRRVGEREDVPVEAAEEHARAVLVTVSEAVTGGEIEHVLSQLPDEYRELFVEPSGA